MVLRIEPVSLDDDQDPKFEAVRQAIEKHRNSKESRELARRAQEMDAELKRLDESLAGGPVKIVRREPVTERFVEDRRAVDERDALTR